MAKSTIFFNEVSKKKVLNAAVLNPIVKLSIASAFEVAKPVEINVTVEIVVIKNLGKICSLILPLAVNVVNLAALKNIANAFKIIKNVDLSANAQIAVMENELLSISRRLGAYFNNPHLIISRRFIYQ